MSYAGTVDTGIPDFPSTVDALQVRDAWIDAIGIRTLITFDSLRSLDLQHSTVAGAVLASVSDRLLNALPSKQPCFVQIKPVAYLTSFSLTQFEQYLHLQPLAKAINKNYWHRHLIEAETPVLAAYSYCACMQAWRS